MPSSIQFSLSRSTDSGLCWLFTSINKSLVRSRSVTSLACCLLRLLISASLSANFSFKPFKLLDISWRFVSTVSLRCPSPLILLHWANNSWNILYLVSRIERNSVLAIRALSNSFIWTTGGRSVWMKEVHTSCTQHCKFEVSCASFCISAFSFSRAFSFPKASALTSSHLLTTASSFRLGSRSFWS